jgi:hypothetical protein
MATQARQVGRLKSTIKVRIAEGALVALFVFLPSLAQAQERQSPVELPPADKVPPSVPEPDVVPFRVRPADRASSASDPSCDVITLGTSLERVSLLLGNPRVGSTIPCLGRRMVSFEDGTKMIFVLDKAISAIPNGLAVGSPHGGYIVERQNRKVFFDPALLCGNEPPSPFAEMKRAVEENFHYLPIISEGPQPIRPPASFVNDCFLFWRIKAVLDRVHPSIDGMVENQAPPEKDVAGRKLEEGPAPRKFSPSPDNH